MRKPHAIVARRPHASRVVGAKLAMPLDDAGARAGTPVARRLRMRLLPAVASLAFAAACGTTTQFAVTNASPRPLVSRPAEQVTVFATGLPSQPFVEVGIIQANRSSDFSRDEMPDIVAAMRRTAGQRGCDGLVLNGPRDQSHSSVVVTRGAASSSSTTLEGFWGACIVFVEPDQAAQR
jgi:hypothetical protein